MHQGFTAPQKIEHSKQTKIFSLLFMVCAAAAIVFALLATPTSQLSVAYAITAGIAVVFAVIFAGLSIYSSRRDASAHSATHPD
jgi:multidrug transporter EmrE-like cation transporter